METFRRYKSFAPIQLQDRTWPNRVIEHAPTWCSVDLRDGNQALIEPMNIKKKLKMFDLLVRMGFKEIEVGFPAASRIEFDFIRTLIDDGLIPEDVTIQVLTQARDELIHRTFEAVRGARKVIVHLYNSTSELQRRVVFNLDRQGTIDLVVPRARLVKKLAQGHPGTNWTFQYSPESFTGTELDFALEICTAVVNVWQPSPEHKAIINLPATVELSTPNVYADMVEWMSRNLPCRDALVVSVHPHNDRGTGVAAAELAVMAGGERVEGTLFGNGERTGNVDIVTLALNLMTQGVDPHLDISDIVGIARVAEECTGIEIHPRHPYVGGLAFTAFSGSHQDAIKKGRERMRVDGSGYWEVPYLPVDPADIGRSYQSLIRVNSQSGKGGIAYVMEHEHHLLLPRGLQIDFSAVVQKKAEQTGKEVGAQDLWELFKTAYLDAEAPFRLIEHLDLPSKDGRRSVATIAVNGVQHEVAGIGNGPLDAFVNAMRDLFRIDMSIASYSEHSISGGSDAAAIAYVSVHFPGREPVWGAGMDTDITRASLFAVVSALNRAHIPLSR